MTAVLIRNWLLRERDGSFWYVHWSFILLKCLLKAALHTQLVLLCDQSEQGEGRVIATLNAIATFKVASLLLSCATTQNSIRGSLYGLFFFDKICKAGSKRKLTCFLLHFKLQSTLWFRSSLIYNTALQKHFSMIIVLTVPHLLVCSLSVLLYTIGKTDQYWLDIIWIEDPCCIF